VKAAIVIKNTHQQDNIELFDHHIAIDLITTHKLLQNKVKSKTSANQCLGAYVLDTDDNQVKTFKAKQVILATGGASKVYLYTSNRVLSTTR